MSIFDVNSPKALFFHVQMSMNSYSSGKDKKISDLFFLIMALNHLREWIAPGYQQREDRNRCKFWPEPKGNAEIFSRSIYEDGNFETLRRLCNGTKHLSWKGDTSAEYGLKIDEWKTKVDDVEAFDNGPQSQFYVDGKNIEDLFRKVIAFYSDNWFDIENV